MSIRDYIKQKLSSAKTSIKDELDTRKQEKLADKNRYRMAKSKEREVRRQEQEREMIKTAKYKERLKGEKRRQSIKQGGFLGNLVHNVRTNQQKNVLSSNRISMGPSHNIVTGEQFGKPIQQRKKAKSRSKRRR